MSLFVVLVGPPLVRQISGLADDIPRYASDLARRRRAVLVFTADRREQGERLLNRAVDKIGGYVGGNLATSGVCAVLTLVALLIAGVPFAIPLALWRG